MESIGKVVLMPKGTYSAGTTYSHLDWVRYNGKSWVCKQDNVIGVTPSEGATWTVLAEDGQGGGGQGVPAGGTTGQVLAKASNTDYDTEWVNGGGVGRSEQAVLGAKNLLENTATTQEINGVTFTVNTDGTVGVNGTASATTVLPIATNVTTGNRDLIMSGCPAGGSSSGYSLKWRMTGSDIYDYGEGVDIPANSSTALSVEIRINNGYNASNLLFKPMLRLASDPDSTYAPYAMTNKQLTDAVENISVDDVTNSTATFSQAGSRANLVSGEKMSVLFGKIMKWFADLKDLAFIAKDGVSSTKYLRGDGTWQTFPTIPTVDQTYSASSTNAQSGTAVAGAISGKQDADDKMTSADMTDVLTPLPSARGNWQEYSDTEKRVGTWIDGKPLYQITLTKTIPSTGNKAWHAFSEFDITNKNFVDVKYLLKDNGTLTAYGRDTYVGTSASAMFTYKSANITIRDNALQIYVAYVTAAEVTVYVTIQYTKTTD